jgi:predicted dehydrogenase
VDLVDVCTPGSSHAEISIAALEAGRHVLCEKPLANTVEEARAMAAAAERAATGGVRAMVGFNFRRVPAVALARELVAAGRLGAIRHVRAAYWPATPSTPSCRWPGGTRPTRRGRARSATSAPTPSTWPSTWPGTGSPGSRR